MKPRATIPLMIACAALFVPRGAHAADAGEALAAAMAGTRVPAMGLVVLREGHVSALAVRGVRVIGGTDRVQPDDPWHIGSDAKAMTAVLIARLVERGLLHWDDRVGTVLPEWAMQPRYARARIDALLSHHAGLPRDLTDGPTRAALFADNSDDSPSAKRTRYLARALAEPPVGRAGFHYSNTGYLLAAAIAERVTGTPWETLLRSEVLTPLGIDHARFGTTGPGEPQGHRGDSARGPADTNPPWFAPAGGFILPLEDWAKFALDQLAGAKGQGRLLRPETYRRMQTATGSGHYAMGWEVWPDYAGRAGPVLVHAGSDTNWYAIAALFPGSGTGVMVAANAGPDMDGETASRAALGTILPDIAGPEQ
jgi:CubicO group peptidase (beta-lactamase class C family)